MPTKTSPRKAAAPKKAAASTPTRNPKTASKEGRLKDISVGRRDVRKLRLADIEPLTIPGPNGGKPVRFNTRQIDTKDPKIRAELDELKALIREHGQKEPGRGRMQPNGKFGLTDGERRHIVLGELAKGDKRFAFMEICPEAKGTTDEERDFDLVTCNSGVPLNMLEQGAMYLRRKDAGMAVAVIARKAAKTEQHIYDCLKLIGLPAEVQTAVRENKIAGTTVVQIAKKVEPELIASTVKTTIATATLQGKAKASNRHVPATSGRKKPKRNDSAAAKKDLEKRGEQTRNEPVDEKEDSAAKLRILREGVIRSRCIPDRYDSVTWILDYLIGEKELPAMIDFLKGNEPLL